MKSRKKTYPGEKEVPFLDRISKVEHPLPIAGEKNVPSSFSGHTMPPNFVPIPAYKILAGALASLIILVTSLVLIFGTKRGEIMDGVPLERQMLAAGFMGLFATVLMIISGRRIWLLMLLFGLMLSGVMVCLPLYFSDTSGSPSEVFRRDTNRAPSGAAEGSARDPIEEMIGLQPLLRERARLLEEDKPTTALGVWLRNLELANSFLVRDFIIREMRALPETHCYPRGSGSYLMVVTGVEDDLEGLAKAVEPLGKVEKLHEDLRVVEVSVDNTRFVTAPMEKLTNADTPQFYTLNLGELNSFDSKRVISAAHRLCDVEPKLLKEDISTRLIELLEGNWIEDKAGLCRALLVWSQPDGGAGKAALSQAVQLHCKMQEVPAEMVALCLKHQEMGVLPILLQLWRAGPIAWEPWFREAGGEAENIIVRDFEHTSGLLRQSACRILGHIGGETSLELLRDTTFLLSSDTETRIIAKSSIHLIEKRLSQDDSR